MTDANFDAEAGRWFLLQQSGRMTRAERKAFDVWLSQGHGPRLAYQHAQRIWRIAGDVGAEADRSLADVPDFRERNRWRSPAWRWSLGIAASVALTIAAFPNQTESFIDARLAVVRGEGQLLTTGANRRVSTTLADGTVVTLDTGTRMRVLEMGARRRIELLAGHAFFRVAKDPAHPFLVTAMNKTVHAIGTAFDVRVEPDAVAVTLVEGKVRVDQPRGLLRDPISADMTPGKQLVASNDQVWLMSQVNTAEATSWLGDRVSYSQGTVGQIVADINAGSARKIVFLGPIDNRQPIFGVFERGDTDTLATVFEVKGIAHVVSRDDDRIEMASGPP